MKASFDPNYPQKRIFFRMFMNLIVLGALTFTPLQVPNVIAAGNDCATSGPVSGAYTVTVCITGPIDGASVSGLQNVTTTVNVNGTNPGVAKLVFYLGGQYLLTDYQAPFNFTLPTSKWVDGGKSLEAEVLMKDGFTSQRASLKITLNNGVSLPPINNNSFTPASGTTPLPGQAFTLVATGDGASGESNAGNVSDLITSWNPNLFLYLGDVYEDGSYAEFYNWYGATDTNFGRLRSITNPIVGNHEYQSGGTAPGYFDYWDNVPKYYSYDVAGWHFIALDSNCGLLHACAAGQDEYQWLLNDLNTHSNTCMVAYFHHPVFNVGPEGYATGMNDIWALLAQHGVDIVLNGHDHDYQRWVPLDGSGVASPTGITEFVVGGGGHGVQHFITTDNRMAVGYDDTAANPFGALRLQLNQDGASYQYINTSGSVLDSGSVACSGAPADVTAPGTPTNLAAVSNASETVNLNWTAATDNVGVTEYDVYRNGSFLTTIPAVTNYADNTTAPNTAYTYQLRARDATGHTSGLSTSATITTPTLLFSDGFESGDLSQWMNINGLTVQQAEIYQGQYAARETSSGTPTYAYRQLSQTKSELYYRVWVKIVSQGANSVYIQRFRTSAGGSILGLFISSTGKLGYRNDVTALTTTSATTVTPGTWHEIQTHVLLNGAAGATEVWLDNVLVGTLSNTENLGTTPIGLVQLGDNSTARTYDVALDRVALSTQFINSTDPLEVAPTANDQSVSTNEDTAKVITLTATDPNNGVLNYQVSTPPQHGSLTGTAPNLTYTPDANYNGGDSLTFEAIDGTVHSNTATVTITVTPVNDPPTNIGISSSTVDENQPIGTTVGVLSTQDADVGDSFAYTFCGGADDASFQISGSDLQTAAVFNYEARTSYSICVRSTDGGLLAFDKTLTISINNLADTSTFMDVPIDYWAFQDVEALYAARITGGCGTVPMIYCPAAPVTRAQMAVFLLRGIHGSGYVPPTASGTVFTDVPIDYWASAWIEQLAAEGITTGCDISLFCPETIITRDQLAVFLLRAEHGSSYTPPPATGASFADVPADYWAAAWIEQLVTEGLTTGCGSGNYCPTAIVTRDQMAVFLVKVFNL